MKELFYHIRPNQEYSPPQILVLKFGEREISCAVTNKEGSELYYLVYCVADDSGEIKITDFEKKYPALNDSYYDVKVIFDYPQSILSPVNMKITEETLQLLESPYGKMGQITVVTEDIPEWQLKNLFAVPKEIYDWVTGKFPMSKFWHQYSLGIRNINAAAISGSLAVDFRKNDFTIIAAKSGKFLLAQTFDYSTPADVLYYLLKTCQQFSLSQQEVQLQLSGLIDKQSSLYNELYQYFKNIGFREANWNIQNGYPAHFFTSLNDLAKCAS